jgi:hypothetical protein
MLKRVFNLNANTPLPDRRLRQEERRGVARNGRGIETEEQRLRREIDALRQRERQPQQEEVEEDPKDYFYKGIVIATRHGKTPSNAQGITLEGKEGDRITPESVQDLYRAGRKDLATLLEDTKIGAIRNEDIAIRHSNKNRTLVTPQALITGMQSVNQKFEEPKSQEDLPRYNFSGMDIKEDSRISYKSGNASVHEKLFKAEKTGINQILNHWLRNPLTNKHAHEQYGEAKIEPFISVYKRTKESLQEALEDVRTGKHKAFFLGSHGSLKEPMILSVLYAAGARNVRDIEQIGGPVEKEEYFVILVRQNKRTGRDEGLVRFRGRAFTFDLDNFMDNSKDPYIAEVIQRLHGKEFDNANIKANEELLRQRGYGTPRDAEGRDYTSDNEQESRVYEAGEGQHLQHEERNRLSYQEPNQSSRLHNPSIRREDHLRKNEAEKRYAGKN